ncbi:hypothetical protein SOX05_08845 [Pseudomonas putida]|nr:hypothetical protein [Pseudomonas putida]MDY4319369.1 hypothetical protein [Pseudomonas putida]MDY4352754.1 hypothetical protein [Pseudomonas putida]
MREIGVRKAFSVRDKRNRVKAIKSFVAEKFARTYKPASAYSRYAELKFLTKHNKYFLTQDLVMKEYRKQGVSRISQKYEVFYSREAYDHFETIILIMFKGVLVCLDKMTDEEIVLAEEHIEKYKKLMESINIGYAEPEDEGVYF